MERTTRQSKRILTNDPSFTAWGWAVVDGDGIVIDSGTIKTAPEHKKTRIRKSDDRTRRISEINQTLIELVHKHHIDFILSELPHGSQNAAAAVMIGAVIGILQMLSDVLELPIEWYSEADSKKALLNKKSATKEEMVRAISQHYKVPWTGIGFRDEAVADALAVHYVASKQSAILKMMKR